TPERPWPSDGVGREQRADPVTADELLAAMDQGGVDRAILVPPSWEGDYNDLALAAAKAHPTRFAVMGRLPLEDPASRDKIAHWREQPGMLGLRFTFHVPHQKVWLRDGTADWVWEAAETAGVPIMVFPPGSLDALEPIAAKHSDLKLIIDHIALRDGKDAEAFWELPKALALAKYPNVAVKASAMPCFSSEPYPYPALHPFLEQAFDAFGPRRFFWGTDWSRLPCSYQQAISLFTEELPWLKGDDLEMVMGRGICDFLGWSV
ncbi:MAG: amidohydrolase, partial [Chloroflexi bacterium]|nr:amidohydrolase [Chloroflexota bacterium]